MSRNAGGTYSLPAGNPVVSGTTIATTWANATLSDIATELTDSLDRSGKGGMLAQFKAYDGTSAAPGISWANELDSGIYRVGSKDFKFQVNAVTIQEWAAAGCVFPLGLTATGAAGASGIVTTGGTSSGAGITATGGGTNGWGVYGTAAGGGNGVAGNGGTTGIGGVFTGGSVTGTALVAQQVGTAGATAPFWIVAGSAPGGAHQIGHMYVTAAGVLKICTVAGTPGTFVSVGSQV